MTLSYWLRESKLYLEKVLQDWLAWHRRSFPIEVGAMRLMSTMRLIFMDLPSCPISLSYLLAAKCGAMCECRLP